ncbi:unnamed protein product [Caenorhabditis bovis]|uniref:SXP/RAL-2 family protein Ani s 5-like cation-binding domain-containing protein n=1 Tax=Caenorhabditis bovis TaxID=2654633 RepID=A0A8S1F0Y8_9PELO|nr:unnamed protein product [Caenorhabditis bovis]
MSKKCKALAIFVLVLEVFSVEAVSVNQANVENVHKDFDLSFIGDVGISIKEGTKTAVQKAEEAAASVQGKVEELAADAKKKYDEAVAFANQKSEEAIKKAREAEDAAQSATVAQQNAVTDEAKKNAAEMQKKADQLAEEANKAKAEAEEAARKAQKEAENLANESVVIMNALLSTLALSGVVFAQFGGNGDRGHGPIGQGPGGPVGVGSPNQELTYEAKGRLICGISPLANVRVVLWDRFRGRDNVIYDETETDVIGNFRLKATKSSFNTQYIQPYLTIYHDCDDEKTPGLRKMTVQLPSTYTNRGSLILKSMDIGTWNLETSFAGEEVETFGNRDNNPPIGGFGGHWGRGGDFGGERNRFGGRREYDEPTSISILLLAVSASFAQNDTKSEPKELKHRRRHSLPKEFEHLTKLTNAERREYFGIVFNKNMTLGEIDEKSLQFAKNHGFEKEHLAGVEKKKAYVDASKAEQDEVVKNLPVVLKKLREIYTNKDLTLIEREEDIEELRKEYPKEVPVLQFVFRREYKNYGKNWENVLE